MRISCIAEVVFEALSTRPLRSVTANLLPTGAFSITTALFVDQTLTSDDAATGFGLNSPLHVGSTGFYADGFHDLQGVITHGLVSAVIEALDRSHRDGVTGMHAHGVQVFDGADDNGVALLVAHDFHFEFFPAEERFFDKDFVVERGVKAAVDDGFKFFGVVGDTATGTTEGKARADDQRPAADGVGDSERLQWL